MLFHIAHDMPGNGLWIFVLVLQGIVLYSFKDYAKKLIIQDLK